MPIFEVQNLTKIFGKNVRKAAQLLDEGKSKAEVLETTGCTVGVNRANFDVEKGEVFVIMGLSGSGKSTLVRMINRLINSTSGKVLFNNEDIASMDEQKLREVRRKSISMVFQRFALFPHRTILENAAYGLEVQGISKQKREQQAYESLQLVGLKGYEHQYPDQLSGGMQQRVGLARALANDPEVLLMDEAFSALDPLIRKDMQDELMDLQSTMKKTIIFITHDLDEALRIGDRIALMRDGSIVQIGTPEEILTRPANDYVERFVEDVDLAKVFTAGHVMKRAETITHGKDGLRVALRRMKEVGISSIFVVDRQKRLIGSVMAKEASEALNSNEGDIDSILIKDLPTTHPETHLNELFDMTADASIPVAVIDDEQKLRGVIVRGAILAALAGNGVSEDGE